jgi:hypothetical protein
MVSRRGSGFVRSGSCCARPPLDTYAAEHSHDFQRATSAFNQSPVDNHPSWSGRTGALVPHVRSGLEISGFSARNTAITRSTCCLLTHRRVGHIARRRIRCLSRRRASFSRMRPGNIGSTVNQDGSGIIWSFSKGHSPIHILDRVSVLTCDR